MITLYLDMDGVLADFHKAYNEFDTGWDKKKFRQAVLEHKIFENLDFMPNTQTLLNHVCRLPVQIEILTSMGTFDPFQGEAAKQQKLNWLRKKNLPWKANFVRCKEEKAQYANTHCILIDDSIGCITPFNARGGHGILHVDSAMDETLLRINSTILSIQASDSMEMVNQVVTNYGK